MSRAAQWTMSVLFLLGLATTASADVVTDWNEKAISLAVKRQMLPPQAERIIACMHLAIFDAVNSPERRYQPYGISVAASNDASKEAAAAAAAVGVLAQLFPADGE